MSKYFFLSHVNVTAVVAKPINSTAEIRPQAPRRPLSNSSLTKAKKLACQISQGSGWCFIYPKDFTSGCTLQARNFQRDLAKYEQVNAVILGVSVDTAESHKDFCAKEGLAFKLLSDPDGKISQLYGSTMEYNGATYSARNTFIIDPKGKIAKVFVKVGVGGHSDEVLAALAELQKAKA